MKIKVDSIDAEVVGKFLKELRLSHNISQQNLADMLYITRQSVSLWETGKTLPDYDLAVLLANYFEITIGELFAGKRITDPDELNRATANVLKIELRRSQRIFACFIIFVIVSALGFLTYFFINNYNSIKIYTVDYANENVLVKGLITRSVKNIYANIEIDSNPSKICLKYINNDINKNIICRDNSNNVFFREKLGYNELIDVSSFDDFSNNLYLSVVEDDKTNEYKLNVILDYKNDELIFNNDDNISDGSNNIISDEVPKYIKDNFEYNEEDNTYSLYEDVDSGRKIIVYNVLESVFSVQYVDGSSMVRIKYSVANDNIITYVRNDSKSGEVEKELFNISKNDKIYKNFKKEYIDKYLK